MAVSDYTESPGFPFNYKNLKKALEASKLEKKLDTTVGKSMFLNDLKNMFKKYKKSSPNLTAKNIVRHYKRNMQISAQILKANNISTYFFLQPLLYYKVNKSPNEIKIYKKINNQFKQITESTYVLMSKSLEEISKSTGAKYKNLKNAFEKDERDIFKDPVHLTNLGQEILSDIIFASIKNELFFSLNN
tara:strand:- start:54 stop:620 length:567 start_codon:yes stop_codon:yes gene_type:complete